MIRAAGVAARVTAGVAATLVAVRAHAATPAQDYVLNCMGCHGTEAQ